MGIKSNVNQSLDKRSRKNGSNISIELILLYGVELNGQMISALLLTPENKQGHPTRKF